MACRIDYHFKNAENIWREVWWTADNDVGEALAGAKRLAPLRAGLLGKFSILWKIVTTNLDRLNQTASYTYDPFPPGEGADLKFNTDTAWDAIVCRVSAQSAGAWYHRVMWLRGIPDDWIRYDTNNNPVFNNSTTVLVNAFVNGMTKNGGYKLYIRSVSRAGGANPRVPVTALGVTGGPNSLVTVSAANTGYNVGDKVSIKGCKGDNLRQAPPGRKGVNGQWLVVAATNSLVTIGLPSAYLPGVPLLREKGTIRSNNLTFTPVASVTPLYFGSKATAGFPGQGRGAKRRRKPSIP